MVFQAVIFDLDGVLVSTDEFHYKAWKELADNLGIAFNHEINERLRGVSRMESLEIILERSSISYTDKEKIDMATRKNDHYRELLNNLSADDVLPGVNTFIDILTDNNIRLAVGSSSKNAPLILQKTGLSNRFEVVVDGNQIAASKPDPEVFLKAALQLEVKPAYCLVVEDADAGVEAAIRAGMKVLGVGSAALNPQATFRAATIDEVINSDIMELLVYNPAI
jgi:beta-phosphoglucomutase